MARKLIGFDPETLQALELLSSDSGRSLQQLADEAFTDLLSKHHRPRTFVVDQRELGFACIAQLHERRSRDTERRSARHDQRHVRGVAQYVCLGAPWH